MKKILIAAVLLASAGAAQAAPQPCNPATGNWENAAPSTCRFVSPHNPEQAQPETVYEIPTDEIPRDEVPA